MPRPTKKQLDYLYAIGYDGKIPTSSAQASLAITEMNYSGDSEKAERAVIKQREREKRERRDSQEVEIDDGPEVKPQSNCLQAVLGCFVIIVALIFALGCCIKFAG